MKKSRLVWLNAIFSQCIGLAKKFVQVFPSQLMDVEAETPILWSPDAKS